MALKFHANEDKNSFELMRLQFVQSLLENLLRRFPDRLLLIAGTVLSPSSWTEQNEHFLAIGRYIVRLAGLCHLNSAKACLANFASVLQNNTKKLRFLGKFCRVRLMISELYANSVKANTTHDS